MKNFQQNLLIALALGLCGLCAWQWYVQGRLHAEGARSQAVISKQLGDIQGYTNAMKNMDSEISGLSTRVAELKAAAKTNEDKLIAQDQEIVRLRSLDNSMSNQIVADKKIVDELDAKLETAYAGIRKQNDALTKLVSERDDAIKKYNDSILERNALTEKYNSMVERFNKLEAAAAAAAAPSK